MSVSTRLTKTRPVVAVARQRDRAREAVGVRLRRLRVVDVAAGEDVGDLADARARARRPRGCARGSSAAWARARSRGGWACGGRRPARPRTGRAITRATACSPVSSPRAVRQAAYSSSSGTVVLVRGDLEDGVGGGVDDPLARALVLLAEPLDDLGARGGDVADHAAPGGRGEGVEQLLREAVGVGRERALGDDAGQLPVADGRVLALRALEQAAGHRRRRGVAAGSPRAAARCRGRAPAGAAARARRRPRRRGRACSSPRRRRRRRRAARRPRRRRAPR